MKISLRPHSAEQPLEIGEDDYNLLVKRKAPGWSDCADETEWLAKLHYLRAGFEQDKTDAAEFEKRELRLVQNWLGKFAR